jgi:ABC-type polysaccharide/polyol phosphate transport system ATPase subunit/SAM-dependent methyltransferase
MARVALRNVNVDFPLLQSEQRSFKRLLSAPLRTSRFGNDGRNRPVLHALRRINLTLDHGDRVAVIGANGAGKSTLLRVLAGIYPPVVGTVAINGRVGALLTTGLGMRDDVSGHDNIEFCLLLQGVPSSEIARRRGEIAAFSELGDYLNLHVGAYSSGMRVRLAFAISTALDPDILVIDEIFGAGDVAFMKKAETRMLDLIGRSSILVFASHAPELLEQFCDTALWLDDGEIRLRGPVREIYQAYLASVQSPASAPDIDPHDQSASGTGPMPKPDGLDAAATTLRAEIEQICVVEGRYPEDWPRHDHCPACGGRPLLRSFMKYGFSHDRCAICGFVCVNPYPPDDVISKLYSGVYYARIRELFERPLLERKGLGSPFSAPRGALEAMVRRATDGRAAGSWLDVGGGLGAFAQLIRTMRPEWQVKVNEFNPQSIAIARELFDFEILTADPVAMLREGQSFDVVSSVAVVEHIPTPFDFVRDYAALVKPGGWLVFITPHFSPLNGFVSHGSSPTSLPPHHVSLFNVNALRSMLERVEGFEVVAIEQAGPAAFELIHHAEFGDYWDIEVPTARHPEPRPLRVRPYDAELVRVLSILSEADSQMGDYFAERDGRLHLISYCRRRVV